MTAEDASPAPTPPTSPSPDRERRGFDLGAIVGTLGALLVGVSIFVTWIGAGDFLGDEASKAGDVSVQFLWDSSPADSEPSILVLLVPIVVLLLVGAWLPRVRWLCVVGGIGATFVGGLVIRTINDTVGSTPDYPDAFVDVLAAGPFLAIVGGIAGIVAGLVWRGGRS